MRSSIGKGVDNQILLVLLLFAITVENTKTRESKAEYESRLIATDRDGQAVETNVVIKLRDENDNAPKFTQPPKEVDFDEAKPTGSLIAR